MDGLPADVRIEDGSDLDVDELYRFVAMVTAEEGSATIPRDFLAVMVSMPGVEPDRDVRLVRDTTGALVGGEFVQHVAPHVEAFVRGFVHPDRRGEGIGSALLGWALGRAADRVALAPDGARVAANTVVNEGHEPTMSLLGDTGFARSRYFLEMHRDFDGPPESAAIPDGIDVRTMRGEEELGILYDAVDAAFRDHFGYTDRPREEGLERWRTYRSAPMWEDDLVWLAFDGDRCVGNNVVLGAHGEDTSVGYVANIGVRREWRGRGLARALLLTSFTRLYNLGKTAVALDVDAESLTGATRLYEAVGMTEVRRQAAYERELRPGRDIVTR